MTLTVMLSLVLSSLSQALEKAIQAASQLDYTPLSQTYAKLNEVMAKPEADRTAWMEILIARDTLKVFLPLISQNVPTTSTASVSTDPSAAPVSLCLDGWKISNGEGPVYFLPDGLGDIFGDEAGQAGLYMPGSPSSATIADFVAWGAPNDGAAADAIAACIWAPGTATAGDQRRDQQQTRQNAEDKETCAKHCYLLTNY